jgi:hypothetical protein
LSFPLLLAKERMKNRKIRKNFNLSTRAWDIMIYSSHQREGCNGFSPSGGENPFHPNL